MGGGVDNGGSDKPFPGGGGLILLSTLAIPEQDTDAVLSRGVSLEGSLYVPFQGLGVVFAVHLHHAHTCGL